MVLRVLRSDGHRPAGLRHCGRISTRPPPPPAVAAVPPPPTKTTVLSVARATRAGSLLKPEDLAAKEILIQDRRRT